MSETVKTKDIPAHIPLMAAAHVLAPTGTDSRWWAWDALASACAETDDLDHTSIVEEVRSLAPVYAAAPELLAMLEALANHIGRPVGGWQGLLDGDSVNVDIPVGLLKLVESTIATVKGETNE